MGTKGASIGRFPPVPTSLLSQWEPTNPATARARWQSSHIPTVPTTFFEYIERVADQDHTLSAGGVEVLKTPSLWLACLLSSGSGFVLVELVGIPPQGKGTPGPPHARRVGRGAGFHHIRAALGRGCCVMSRWLTLPGGGWAVDSGSQRATAANISMEDGRSCLG